MWIAILGTLQVFGFQSTFTGKPPLRVLQAKRGIVSLLITTNAWRLTEAFAVLGEKCLA